MDLTYQIRQMDWDTRFFEEKMGEILLMEEKPGFVFSKEAWRRTLEGAAKADYRFLLCQFDAKHSDLCQHLSSAGILLGDLLVQFELVITGAPVRKKPAASVRIAPVEPADLEEVMHIAGHSFKTSRFFQDPGFERAKVQQFYPTWIQDSLGHTEHMVVLKKADQIGGFLSYQETQPGVDITIRLLATRDEMQGQGLGQALLDWLIDFAVERKYSILRVGTQINNYTAIRLYQKRGFILTAARYRWHVWLAYQPVGLQLQRDRWE